MAIFADMIRDNPGLAPGDAEWLHLLVGDWQMIADLSFADLVLWFPAKTGTGHVALAHVRPSTSHTMFHADFVGEQIQPSLEPLVKAAWKSQNIERSHETKIWSPDMAMRVEAIPMVRNGRTLAVITTHMDLSSSRMPSRLELTYRQYAYDLLKMGTLGLWPDFASPTGSRRGAPRVGDGLLRLDVDGIVQYASPNGVSAFRRLGDGESLEGRSLAEVTTGLLKDRRMVDESLPLVVTGRMPWRTEIESRGVSLSLRAIPLRDGVERFGALVLCRDVSELRRREQELVTKDASIREIHHRVKNNLQTVAALLRMQSRRMKSEEGREALRDAMRRVSSIAVVHDTLGDVDIIGFCVPANEPIGPGDKFINEQLESFARTRKVAIVTKTDSVGGTRVAEQLLAVSQLREWDLIIPLSAVTGDQVDLLAEQLIALMPESPALYDDDAVTDESTDDRVSELIREAALEGVSDELPRGPAVRRLGTCHWAIRDR